MSINDENPFLDRNKVTKPEAFYGRSIVRSYILERARYHKPQSVAVIGERRIGKSSLLTNLQYVLAKEDKSNKLISILLDPEEIATDHPEDITWSIIDELISEEPELLKYVQHYPAKADEKQLPKRRSRIVFKNLLKDACENGYRFVLFIDEFELLAENKELHKTRYLQYLRGLADNYKLAFVTSSRKDLKDISYGSNSDGLDKETSPFDNNFSHPVYLGLFKNGECYDLIEGTLGEEHRNMFGLEEKEAIIKLAGKHPYFLKIACAHLYDSIKKGETKDAWKDKFKKEATEEFNRMWQALGEGENGKENQEWILTAQQKVSINEQEMKVSLELESLYKRGIFELEDKKLVLFSTGFSDYIKDYVKGLENEYLDIERHVGLINIDPIQASEIREEINTLKTEWESRNKKSGQTDKSFIRCDHFFTIVTHVVELFAEIGECRRELNKESATRYLSQDAEAAIIKLAQDFEHYDWFKWLEDHKKHTIENCNDSINEDHKDCISVAVGKKMLDSLIDYLQQKNFDSIFGNGFDKLLAVRIEYMKEYGWKNFPEFQQQAKDTFHRLTTTYDHARTAEMLQMAQNQNRPIKWIMKKYFEHPERVIGVIVLGPFILINFIIWAYYQTNDTFTQPPTETWISLLWILPLFVQLYFLWVMYRPYLYEKYCPFPSAKNLLRKSASAQWNCLSLIVMGYIAIVICVHNCPQVSRELMGRYPFITLFAGVVIGLIGLIVTMLKIRPKVKNFEVALRRATYYCSITYVRSLWLIFLLSGLSYLLTLVSPSWKSFDFMTIMVNEYSRNKNAYSFKWFFPDVINIGGWSVVFPLVLALSLVSPIIGLMKGCSSKTLTQKSSD